MSDESVEEFDEPEMLYCPKCGQQVIFGMPVKKPYAYVKYGRKIWIIHDCEQDERNKR